MPTEFFHNCIVVDAAAPLAPYAAINSNSDADGLVAAYSDAGVSLAVFTVVDDFPNSIEQTVKLIGQNRRYFLSQPDRFVLADCAVDVRRAHALGKLAVGFAFQGTNALLGELALVEVYRRLGVIQMLLAYNAGNLVADGCHEPRNAGLTSFGRSLIAEMNRVGMIVDVTHVGYRSSLEAIELTAKPPIFSHSTPKRFAPHDRNISDDQILACAAKGGLVCLSGVGLFMDADHPIATVGKLADTIEYVAQLAGPRHVGVGLDYVIDPAGMEKYIQANSALYGGGDQYPDDGQISFAAPSVLRPLCGELLERGYDQEDVAGILGANYLRVLGENQHNG